MTVPLTSTTRGASPDALGDGWSWPGRRTARAREWRLWLALGFVASLLFMLWPQLDLLLSGAVYDPGSARFTLTELPPVQLSYLVTPWIGRLMLLLGLLALGLGWRRRQRLPLGWLLRWQRRLVTLLGVLVLGLGLVVNAGLKEFWGRPRPTAVVAFGGTQPFMPIWPPSSLCRSNCSFVSGHAGTGFVLIGLGLTAAPARRRHWRVTGLSAGLLIGLGRVLEGGHFASDIVYAGLVIWGVCLVWREWLLRRRAQRMRRVQQPAALPHGSVGAGAAALRPSVGPG